MNDIVVAIGKIHFEGNVIPHSWFQSDELKKPTGKAFHLAILILADIVYWYRPTPIFDEEFDEVIGYKQKFNADMLQKQYSVYAEMFGVNRRQIKEAIDFLIDRGFVNRQVRNVTVKGQVFTGRVFLEPNPKMVQKITFRKLKTRSKLREVPKK